MSIETYYDNYLQHHGIKGQKWGKKNGPPYPLDPETDYSKEERTYDKKEKNFALTDKQKRYIRNGAIAVGAILTVAGGMYLYKKGTIPTQGLTTYAFGTKLKLDDFSDTLTRVGANATLHRVSYRPINESIEHGKMYVSFLNRDNAAYIKEMPSFHKYWKSKGIIDENAKTYVNKMKLKRDLLIAPEREVVKAYLESTGRKEIDAGKLAEFYSDLIDDTKENTKFMNILKEKGFDGMIDYNDAKNWTKAPLIIFTPKDVVSKTSSHELGKIDKFISVILS